MPDRTGQQLGSYRLLSLIGRGGFAEVYLGQHVRLPSQRAALKILSTRLEPEDIQAFEREAETIAGLVHPHIIRVLDYDSTEGLPFLVMDYAPNGSLRRRHRKGEQVPLPTVISYVQQVTEGLQYAHDHKIIHRDIKPDNMLVGARQEIVLSDFGIATIAHSTTSQSAQTAIGTIPYMAPEQIQEYPRPASDQYALGITVYEWLAGERPFQGSFTEIAVKHAMMPPPPLRNKRSDLPLEVEQVISRALAKDPRARFARVQDFFIALVAASRTPFTNTSPPSIISPTIAALQPIQAIPMDKRFPPSIPSQSHPLPPTIAAPAHIPTEPAPTTDNKGMISRNDERRKASKRDAGKKRLPRRAVIVGIVTAGVVGTGIVWISSAQQNSIGHSLTPPHPSDVGSLLYTYRGHSDYVNGVAWSPNSKCIASSSEDKTVQVWDATDGGNVFTYRYSDSLYIVAWSPDGKRIASISNDKTVQVWDATDGGNAFTYRGHSDRVKIVVWSPDSKRIASGSEDKTVQIWDAADGGNAFTYHGYSGNSIGLAWSHDGRRIASADEDKAMQVRSAE